MSISRKIGLHIINSTGLVLGQPAVVKLVDPSLDYYRKVRTEVGADCLIVVRWYHPVQSVEVPVPNAMGWYQAHFWFIDALPTSERVVYEGWNEIGDAQAAHYASFELARLQLLHGAGRRACIGNWSVGVPDLNVWPVYAPVIAAMRDTDVVGLHEYWSDRADIDNLWHVRRFTLPAVARNLAGKQIVVTECGRDIVEGKGQPGWQHTTDAAGFLADLRRAGELYDGCANVIGACVFQTGSTDPQWGPFNAYPVWPQVVAEYGAPVSTPVPPPVLIPTPPAVSTPLSLVPPIDKANIVRISQPWNPPTHFGIDYSCYEGKPIYAAAAGIAYPRTDTAPGGGFGKYVRIETHDGQYKVYTAHLSAWGVVEGARVTAGQRVGWSGNTGNSTGPHMHFEVRRVAGSAYLYGAIDPTGLIVWPPVVSTPPVEWLPTTDPMTTGAATEKERYVKIRWWMEQAVREEESGDADRARRIRLALIEQMYVWENL